MLCFTSICFFFYCSGANRDLPSFPTRRSSDLNCSIVRRCSISRIRGSNCVGSCWQHHKIPDPIASRRAVAIAVERSEEHTSELQSQSNLVCRLLLEKKKATTRRTHTQPSESSD